MCYRKTHSHTGGSHSKLPIIVTSCGQSCCPAIIQGPCPFPLPFSSTLSRLLFSPQSSTTSSLIIIHLLPMSPRKQKHSERSFTCSTTSCAHLPASEPVTPSLPVLLWLWVEYWGSQPRPHFCTGSHPSQCHKDISPEILPLPPAPSISPHFLDGCHNI